MTQEKCPTCETSTCGKAPAPALPEVLDVKQAAEFLGVKVHTLYYLLEHKQLKARRVGKEYRILQSSLRAWLAMSDK